MFNAKRQKKWSSTKLNPRLPNRMLLVTAVAVRLVQATSARKDLNCCSLCNYDDDDEKYSTNDADDEKDLTC